MNNKINNKREHIKLKAIVALIENGYEVLMPIEPEPYDFTVRDPRTREFYRLQVMAAQIRGDRRGSIVVRARKVNGQVYSRNDIEYLAGVYEDNVFLIPNNEQTEYWSNPEVINDKWTQLT